MIKLCHPFWSIFAGLSLIVDPHLRNHPVISMVSSDGSADQLLAATAETGPAGLSSLPQLAGLKIPCSGAHLWWRREGKILEKNLNRKILGSCWGSITMQNAAIFAQKIAVRATFKSLDHPRFIRVKETNFAENPAESILPPGHCHCSFPLSCPAWLTGSVLWDPLKSQENRTILKRRCKRQTEVREKNRGISNWRS